MSPISKLLIFLIPQFKSEIRNFIPMLHAQCWCPVPGSSLQGGLRFLSQPPHISHPDTEAGGVQVFEKWDSILASSLGKFFELRGGYFLVLFEKVQQSLLKLVQNLTMEKHIHAVEELYETVRS